MDIQLKKGLLEAYVLYLLSLEPAYGYSLYSKIVADDFTISENTLYPIFKRLERDELVSSYNEEHNGRLRKYYRITNLGLTRLNEFTNTFVQMQKIIDTITKGVKNND